MGSFYDLYLVVITDLILCFCHKKKKNTQNVYVLHSSNIGPIYVSNIKYYSFIFVSMCKV